MFCSNANWIDAELRCEDNSAEIAFIAQERVAYFITLFENSIPAWVRGPTDPESECMSLDKDGIELLESCSGTTSVICQKEVDCKKPIVENGNANCLGTTLGRKCRVACDYGYKPVQPAEYEVKCLPSGKWEEPDLECERIKCRMPNFENQPGDFECTDPAEYGYPGSCTFTCGDSYKLIGSSKIYCKSNGEWDEMEPTCKDVVCPPLSIDGGNIDCTEKNKYSSKCSFDCHYPLKLYGPEYVICMSNEKWSDESPVCTDINPKCPKPSYSLVCDDECNDDRDCKRDEICCPNRCGLVCIPKPKSKKKPSLGFLMPFLMMNLLGGSQKPKPNACTRCHKNPCTLIKCRLPGQIYYGRCQMYCNDCSAHFFDPYYPNYGDITRYCIIEYMSGAVALTY